ncbi:unnamed protein product, partial [Cladocopium goreaui]
MDSNARSLKIQVLTPSPRPTSLFTPMAKGLRCLILLASLLVVDGLATGKLGKELKKEKGYEGAWSLTIQLRFKDVATRDEFLKSWGVLARYVRDYEPFCLLFEAIQSDKDPLLLIVDERYTDKDVYGKHRSSDAFNVFRPQMQKLQDAGDASPEEMHEMQAREEMVPDGDRMDVTESPASLTEVGVPRPALIKKPT